MDCITARAEVAILWFFNPTTTRRHSLLIVVKISLIDIDHLPFFSVPNDEQVNNATTRCFIRKIWPFISGHCILTFIACNLYTTMAAMTTTFMYPPPADYAHSNPNADEHNANRPAPCHRRQ